MPDFRAYVRENLPPLGVSGAQEAEIVEELALEFEERYEREIRKGCDPARALREIADEFEWPRLRTDLRATLAGGSSEQEPTRRSNPMMSMISLFNDARYAVRALRKSPGFAAVAILTLALCLGANLTIFAVIDSILLRPLPFPHSDKLVIMFNTYPNAGRKRDDASLTNYYERRGKISAFSDVAALSYGTSVLGERGATELEDIARVSAEFFTTIGTGPVVGRGFKEEEMTYQTDHEAILTDAYWRQRFNADPNVLGRDVWSDGLPRKIVGILPPDFRFLSSTARIFLPLSSEESERNIAARHSGGIILVARLKPGATIAEAQAQIDANNAALAVEFPYAKQVAEAGFRTIVAPLHADHVASIRPTLLLIQAGVLLLLLMGAVNLLSLLLVRGSSRAKESAIRLALGASRQHLFRQTMVETVLLCLIGGAFGLAAAAAGVRLLEVLGVHQLPLGARVAFDGRLALAALLGATVMGSLVGLAIGWLNVRGQLADTLQSESRTGTSGCAGQRLRESFIVAQISLAFILLAGAGMLGLSLKRTMAVSPGFQPDHVLTGHMYLPWKKYRDASSFMAFGEQLMEELGHQPGVSVTGLTTAMPFGKSGDNTVITVPGYQPKAGESVVLHPVYAVTGRYFAAMGIPLREGRYLDTADSHRAQQVCVVDEVLARRYWPRGSAVGQQVFNSIETKADTAFTIVGVVGAAKENDLTARQVNGAIYLPYSRYFSRQLFVVARTSLPPESLESSLRKSVRRSDPEMAVSDIRSMELRIDASLIARRSPALLAGIFAEVALLLTAIGTYGVLSYTVSQRRREIGLRMALGASPGQVLAQFLSFGAKLLAVGIVLGTLGAWVVGRALSGVLFGVGVNNPGVLAAAAVVMMVVVLLAVFIPSRRAARVCPTEALRG